MDYEECTPFFGRGCGGGVKQKAVSSATRNRLFVKRFLGVDISPLSPEEAEEKIREAEIVREMEVGVMAEAISLVFGGE